MDLEFLTSPSAAQALSELATWDLTELQALDRLRKRFSPQHSGQLWELACLRQKAAGSWKDADRLFFEALALEQSTSWPLAQHRAQQLHERAPAGPFLDLGCGIGADALALARHRPVIAYEKDPGRAALAALNARVLGLPVEVRCEDWRDGALPECGAIFVDPSRRRAQGKRVFSLEQLDPPFSALPPGALCLKVMPGIPDGDIPPGAEVQFVSHRRVCKEAVLWLGTLTRRSGRRASVLTDRWLSLEAAGVPAPLGELEVGMDLHEPDPAVIRAGAIAELAPQLEAHLFDPQIAYLVGPPGKASELAQSFRILAVEPWSLKRLKASLRLHHLRAEEIKKRGSPLEPEELRRLLPRSQGRRGVVVLTRRGDERIFMLAERVGAGAG